MTAGSNSAGNIGTKVAGTIALCDSGVGGLSVLRELRASKKISPQKYIYFGDTARCPYGDRSAKEIRTFASEIVDWLCKAGADAIVMASNTTCALALDLAEAKSSVPVFDIVQPVCQYIAEEKLKVGVIATSSTVKSKAFSKTVAQFGSKLPVLEIACPDLVPLVEAGKIDYQSSSKTLAKYVDELCKAKVDAVVLGCTHYPFLAPVLRQMLPQDIQLIDPAKFIVDKVAELNFPKYANEANVEVYVTGSPSDFAQASEICLGYDLGTIYGISVDELTETSPLESLIPGVTLPVIPQSTTQPMLSQPTTQAEAI